jgi:hypothetical protein
MTEDEEHDANMIPEGADGVYLEMEEEMLLAGDGKKIPKDQLIDADFYNDFGDDFDDDDLS